MIILPAQAILKIEESHLWMINRKNLAPLMTEVIQEKMIESTPTITRVINVLTNPDLKIVPRIQLMKTEDWS